MKLQKNYGSHTTTDSNKTCLHYDFNVALMYTDVYFNN